MELRLLQRVPERRHYASRDVRIEAVHSVARRARYDEDRALALSPMLAASVLLSGSDEWANELQREWPASAVKLVNERGLAAVQRAISAMPTEALRLPQPDILYAVAEALVDEVDEMLAPLVGWCRYAPVAVLCGPRLRRLVQTPSPHRGYVGMLRATWVDGTQTSAPLTELDKLTALAEQLMPKDKPNSHVIRLVHPPGWPHAAAVRQFDPRAVLVTDVVIDDRVVTLRCHARVCRRCDRDRRVWAPLGYVPTRADFGPCSRCDRWQGPSILPSSPVAFDAALLHVGEGPIAWHDLGDRSILEIAAFEARRWRILRPRLHKHLHADLGFALTEARYRNLLPLNADELRVAWDVGLATGAVHDGDQEKLTLAEVWARCAPVLWGGFTRPSTFSLAPAPNIS